MTGPQSPLTRKLSAFVGLGEADLATPERFHQHRRKFEPGHALVHEGQTKASAFILVRGWACAYKILPAGGRQIVDFQVPGDLLGLRSILFRTGNHGIEAVTRIEASEVLTSDILDAFASAPRLAAAVLWAVSRDEGMAGGASCQRGPAVGRGAHGAFPAETRRPAHARGAGGQAGVRLSAYAASPGRRAGT